MPSVALSILTSERTRHRRQADRAWDALRCCRLCEWRCGVDRTAGERGTCGLDASASVFRAYISFAEELELIPALMVYLSGCNLRCRFCTQGPACFRTDWGPELSADQRLAELRPLSAQVDWINWVGGEPSLHPHILAEAKGYLDAGARWILNTNGYFTPECFSLIDETIDLFVVDFKFGCDACAEALAAMPRYVATLRRNLSAIYRTGAERLLVRHLLMPGHWECCFRPVADWLAGHVPEARFHLMGSYVPSHAVMKDRRLGRVVGAEEVAEAVAYARRIGLRCGDGG